MGWFIFLLVAAAVVAGVFWARRYFRVEIERARRIRRANNGNTRR